MMDLLRDVMIDLHLEEMIEEAEDATSALEEAEAGTLVIETEEMEAETLVETEIAEMMDPGDVVEAEVRETLVTDLVEAIVIETSEIGEVVVGLHTVDLEMMTVVVLEMTIDVDQEMMTVAVQEMTTVVDQEMMIADLLVTRDPWTGAVDLEDPLEMTTAVDLEKMTAVDLEKMTVEDLEMMTV